MTLDLADKRMSCVGLVNNTKKQSPSPRVLPYIPQTNIPVFNHLFIYQLTLIVHWVFLTAPHYIKCTQKPHGSSVTAPDVKPHALHR